MKSTVFKTALVTLPLMFGTAFADSEQKSQDFLGGIAPLNNSELELVVGTGWRGGDSCFFCGNYATANQLNLSALSALVLQTNHNGIMQSNN